MALLLVNSSSRLFLMNLHSTQLHGTRCTAPGARA
jgi:hypothetical protein